MPAESFNFELDALDLYLGILRIRHEPTKRIVRHSRIVRHVEAHEKIVRLAY